MELFEKIGKKFGKKRIDSVARDLNYADLKSSPEDWIGRHAVIGLVVSVITTAVVFNFSKNIWFAAIAFPLTVFIYYFLINSIVGILADQRVRNVEDILPDILTLMASNLKSGIPSDEAITSSAREEFGFFADKIRMVAKKLATGIPISVAIMELSKGINSPVLNKTVKLILEGLESGGELSVILEETAADIRDTQIIQKEIRSIIFVYAIFIFIAAVVVAPVLYAVSTHLAQTLTRLSSDVSVAFLPKGAGSAPIPSVTSSNLTSEFLVVFSYINLIITSISGALMVALITRGNEKYGIRYIPIFVAIALALFFVARWMIGGFFQAIRI